MQKETTEQTGGKAIRILYALDSYRPNIDGVAVSIERQARALSARGHFVALIAPAHRLRDYEEREGDIRVLRVRTAQLIRRQWRLAIIPSDLIDAAFDDFRPDIVVVSLPFPLSLRVSNAARQRGVPIVGITGTMPEWLLYSLRWLRPVLDGFYDRMWSVLVGFYERCDVVVGVTATALSYLNLHGLRRPTQIISNGVDLTTFQPRARDEAFADSLGLPAAPTVLYTGRLDPEKRVDVLVKALPLLLARTKAHLIIGGDGSEKAKLMEEVARMGLGDHVTFTGFLASEEYPRVYSLADVFAIASPAELQSIVALEAAASALPIVAVNAGALPELVHHGHNGYLFPDGDSPQLAGYLGTLLEDAERRRWMGTKSRAIAMRHDLARSMEQYEELYLTVVASRYHDARSAG